MNADISGNEISLFLLVLARVGGLVVSAPIVGEIQVPRMVKVGLVLLLSALLVQAPNVVHARVPNDLFYFSLTVLAQLLVGIALGLVARTIFFAVATAAGIVSLQMGLSMASVLNPLTRQPDTTLSQLYTIIASMTFLAVRGDIWMVAALARSFDLAPLTTGAVTPAVFGYVVDSAITVVTIGVQISLPIAASLLAANLVLGVVSRSLPQLNLFVLSMPLNMLLGLVALGGSLAGLMMVVSHLTSDLPSAMLGLLPHNR